MLSMGLLSLLCACLQKRLKAANSAGADEADDEDVSTDIFFELSALQIATNFFSEANKLGHGGFGPVYKGLMPNGQQVAVKKLSVDSRQGVRQFSNEVKLLLRIQHRNLVILLGCCIEGPEKMLVYEYLPNRSLDYFLFGKKLILWGIHEFCQLRCGDLYVSYCNWLGIMELILAIVWESIITKFTILADKKKSPSLNWTTRFHIITSIVRGLLYLHEEAPARIIHRDIKASNILLDEQLNPKISDFGLARLFPGDDTHLNTFKIAGTYGYMAPEYALHGYLSVKSDVFSFGILVLEIVSGRKNHENGLGVQKADLLGYAWLLYQEGKIIELVDQSLTKCNADEAAMCIQLGLLCCQANVTDRPDMNTIHLMLSSDSFTLPRPGKPGIIGRGARKMTTSTSAFSNTNTASTQTCVTRASAGSSSLVEDYSRNSISVSSIDEGR